MAWLACPWMGRVTDAGFGLVGAGFYLGMCGFLPGRGILILSKHGKSTSLYHYGEPLCGDSPCSASSALQGCNCCHLDSRGVPAGIFLTVPTSTCVFLSQKLSRFPANSPSHLRPGLQNRGVRFKARSMKTSFFPMSVRARRSNPLVLWG